MICMTSMVSHFCMMYDYDCLSEHRLMARQQKHLNGWGHGDTLGGNSDSRWMIFVWVYRGWHMEKAMSRVDYPGCLSGPGLCVIYTFSGFCYSWNGWCSKRYEEKREEGGAGWAGHENHTRAYVIFPGPLHLRRMEIKSWNNSFFFCFCWVGKSYVKTHDRMIWYTHTREHKHTHLQQISWSLYYVYPFITLSLSVSTSVVHHFLPSSNPLGRSLHQM